jgi:hypothetical protein
VSVPRQRRERGRGLAVSGELESVEECVSVGAGYVCAYCVREYCVGVWRNRPAMRVGWPIAGSSLGGAILLLFTHRHRHTARHSRAAAVRSPPRTEQFPMNISRCEAPAEDLIAGAARAQQGGEFACVGRQQKAAKRTVPGLRTWSPTVLLTRPDEI